jgi:hypothetical protein
VAINSIPRANDLGDPNTRFKGTGQSMKWSSEANNLDS